MASMEWAAETCVRCSTTTSNVFEADGWFIDLLHGAAFKDRGGPLKEGSWVCPNCRTTEDATAEQEDEIAFYVGIINAGDAEGIEFLRSEGLDDETIAAIHKENVRLGYETEA